MELLKQLYEIYSPSGGEKKIKRFIKHWVKDNIPDAVIRTDNNDGNIYITRGDSESYPCVVAHLDQVQKNHSADFIAVETDDIIFGYSPTNRRREGLGADDKNGIWVSDKWFYFDENFNIVVGDHHGMESWLAPDAYGFPDVSPEEVIDNNPNYYKKDIVKFVYNDDASANLKESIFGADADIGEVFEFVKKSKEIIQLLNSTETANIAHYSLSTRDDLIWVYHYDVRDYEFSISLNGGEKEVYYWDENFNMVKK